MKVFGLRLKRSQVIFLSVLLLVALFLDFMMFKCSLNTSAYQFGLCIFFALFAIVAIVGMPFGMFCETKRILVEKKREYQISAGLIKFKDIDFENIEYDMDHLTILADGKKRKFIYYFLIANDVLKLDEEAFKRYTGRKK